MGRSVKYRRARGVLTAGVEEPNALLTVGNAPHSRSQHSGPATGGSPGPGGPQPEPLAEPASRPEFSCFSSAEAFSARAFITRHSCGHRGARTKASIRRLAGLGEAPGSSDLPAVDIECLDTDVLIAGAGPAGLSAALAASRAGARVVLCEREPVCGGELEFEPAAFGVQSAAQWVDETLATLRRRKVRVLTRDFRHRRVRWPTDRAPAARWSCPAQMGSFA